MTASTEEQPRCTDPAELRQRARDRREDAGLLELRALTLKREAAQADHEAALWEVADVAEAALTSLQQRTAGLEAAAEGSLTAERAVHDRLREDRKHLALRKGQATRAENSSSREAQDEAQVRLDRSQKRVLETETELTAATARRMTDEVALEAHQAALREAQAQRESVALAELIGGVIDSHTSL